MKTAMRHLLPVAIPVLLACAGAEAQDFEMVEFSFASVGLASGGEFEAAVQASSNPSGPDPAEGGEFGITGPAILVPGWQASEPPLLLVERLPGGAVRIAWDSVAAGFALESSNDLRDWVVESGEILAAPGALVVQSPGPARYYRLRKP